MGPSDELVTAPRRSRRWLNVGLATIGCGFVGMGLLMGSAWRVPGVIYPAVWWPLFLAFVAGWAICGAALRPQGSAALGAVLGLVAHVAVGLGIVVTMTLQAGGVVLSWSGVFSSALFAPLWPAFLVGWLGLFGARWD